MALFGTGMEGFTWAALAGVIMLAVVIGLIVLAALYVYYALALSTIAKKLRYKKPWLAWIPGANISLVLILGGFHWAFVFLLFIPVLGWIALAVLTIISMWRVYVKRKYPGWLVLIPLVSFIPVIGWLLGAVAGIANLVILGLVAWVDRK